MTPQISEDTRKRWTLVICCVAQFMVILDVSVVNVALPSIRADLHFTGTELQWVVNAYTLTFAGFLLLGGRAADLLGRRKLLVAGLIGFAATSLIGGLAQTKGMLIGARAAQGLSGAVVAPATLSVLTTHVHRGRRAQPRSRPLGRDGRRRRRCRLAARRPAHPEPQLALDPLHQHPDRPDRRDRGPALRGGEPPRRERRAAASTSPARSRSRSGWSCSSTASCARTPTAGPRAAP